MVFRNYECHLCNIHWGVPSRFHVHVVPNVFFFSRLSSNPRGLIGQGFWPIRTLIVSQLFYNIIISTTLHYFKVILHRSCPFSLLTLYLRIASENRAQQTTCRTSRMMIVHRLRFSRPGSREWEFTVIWSRISTQYRTNANGKIWN